MDGGKVDLQHIWESQPSAVASPKHFDKREHSDGFQKEIEKARKACDLSRGLLLILLLATQITPGSIAGAQIINFFLARWSLLRTPELRCRLHHILKIYIRCIRDCTRPLRISLAIKPWNDCLVKGQPAWGDLEIQGQLRPIPLRITTYGIEWENELPDWAVAFNVPSESRKRR
jgi:hypothetical protein